MCHGLCRGRGFVIRGRAATLSEFREDSVQSCASRLQPVHKPNTASVRLASFYCQNNKLSTYNNPLIVLVSQKLTNQAEVLQKKKSM